MAEGGSDWAQLLRIDSLTLAWPILVSREAGNGVMIVIYSRGTIERVCEIASETPLSFTPVYLFNYVDRLLFTVF